MSDLTKNDSSRRNFIKTAAYVAPLIVTLSAVPAFASKGSYNPPPKPPKKDKGKKPELHDRRR